MPLRLRLIRLRFGAIFNIARVVLYFPRESRYALLLTFLSDLFSEGQINERMFSRLADELETRCVTDDGREEEFEELDRGFMLCSDQVVEGVLAIVGQLFALGVSFTTVIIVVRFTLLPVLVASERIGADQIQSLEKRIVQEAYTQYQSWRVFETIKREKTTLH